MGKKTPKPPKEQTSTSKTEPWAGAQPYIKDYLQKGQTAASQPFNFYNGETIAGFAPEQQMGMNFATRRAMAGSPTLNAANRNVTDTLNGKYMNPDSNPYLRGTVNQALGDVQTRVNSQFNNNNFGSSAHQELMSRNLGEQANNIYGQNYSNERNNQMQMVGQAQGLAQSDYNDANVLQQVGAQRQGQSQRYLDQAKSTFDQANNFQYDQLNRYSDVIRAGQGVGGTTTMTGPGQQQAPGKSPITGLLGGAATGAGLSTALGFAGPWGAVAGGVLGAFGG